MCNTQEQCVKRKRTCMQHEFLTCYLNHKYVATTQVLCLFFNVQFLTNYYNETYPKQKYFKVLGFRSFTV